MVLLYSVLERINFSELMVGMRNGPFPKYSQMGGRFKVNCTDFTILPKISHKKLQPWLGGSAG